MSSLDLDDLLAEISPDSPCGEDLEYDPEFGELERAAESRPEQQMGDSVIEAEEPDWKAVRKLALGLFARTKDLRVALHLARALVRTEGLEGLRDAVSLVRRLLETYWEALHPQLDPDDDNDPTMRVNILIGLCDADTVLKMAREAPLVRSAALGSFGLREMAFASGEVAWPEGAEGQAPDTATIDAAFLDCDLDGLQATADAVRQAREDLAATETFLTDRIGVGEAPDLGALGRLLGEAEAELAERLQRRGVGDGSAAAEDAAVGAGEAAAEGGGARITGAVQGREDVLRTLDLVIGYYQRHEPSSPVPLLLERAKRLVPMAFMDIVRDMAPDGVTQIETIAGASEEEYSE